MRIVRGLARGLARGRARGLVWDLDRGLARGLDRGLVQGWGLTLAGSGALGAFLALSAPGALQAQSADGAEACPAGRITDVQVVTRDIFDPASTDVGILRMAYRAANALHVRTSPGFVRRELLFARGNCVDPILLAESERLLDGYRFLADARVSTTPDGGDTRVLVETRDEWSTQVDVGVTYDAGLHLERFQATELNFLGQGIFAEYTRRNRLEHKSERFGLSTPRFYGRTDAGIEWGTTRAGHSFEQSIRYPFVGETGRISVQESYSLGTDFFAYATEGAAPYSHLLLPVRQENVELSVARRFGGVDRGLLAGVSLTRDSYEYTGAPEAAFDGNFDEHQTIEGELPANLARQGTALAATRLTLHLGVRSFRYREYLGLDGVRDRQQVGLGVFAGLSVGHSIPVARVADVPDAGDLTVRGNLTVTTGLGSSLFHVTGTAEARRDARWSDIQGEAHAVAYLRGALLPSQTLFLKASTSGGWRTELPFQLALGGRRGVRALPDDRFPGGRQVLLTAEDRIRLDGLGSDAVGIGATVFGDLGRVWPGDVPFGMDSGWRGDVGFGLRLAFPAGSRNVYRPDIVFPLGPGGGSPIFRVTLELNRLRGGFFNPDLRSSRRLDRGLDRF